MLNATVGDSSKSSARSSGIDRRSLIVASAHFVSTSPAFARMLLASYSLSSRRDDRSAENLCR